MSHYPKSVVHKHVMVETGCTQEIRKSKEESLGNDIEISHLVMTIPQTLRHDWNERQGRENACYRWQTCPLIDRRRRRGKRSKACVCFVRLTEIKGLFFHGIKSDEPFKTWISDVHFALKQVRILRLAMIELDQDECLSPCLCRIPIHMVSQMPSVFGKRSMVELTRTSTGLRHATWRDVGFRRGSWTGWNVQGHRLSSVHTF